MSTDVLRSFGHLVLNAEPLTGKRADDDDEEGDDDADMAVAANHLIALQGGAAVVRDGQVLADLPLPVAGLMSDQSFGFVEARLRPLRAAAAACGCALEEPLLQLAFLPLPVIPHLKLTDRGYVAAGPDGLSLLPL